MSQLFDALQKIEEKNSLQMQPPPPLSSREKKRRIPYFRLLLFILLIFLCAVFCLIFLRFQPDFALVTDMLKKDAVKLQEKMTASNPMANESQTKKEEDEPSATPEKNSVADSPFWQQVQPEKHRDETPVHTTRQKAANPLSERLEETGNIPKGQDSIDNEILFFSRIQDSADTRETVKMKQQTERKRLIYRAEKQRIQGNLELALKLYIQAWDIDGDAGVANNIAAILIGKKEYALAEEYLRHALKKEPDDRDLLYNLKIVTAEKNREQPR